MSTLPPELKDENVSRSRSEQIVDLLKSYKYIITAVAAVGVTYLVYTGTQLSVPPRFERYTIQFGFGVLVALVPARYVYNRLVSDTRVQLHDVDPISGDAAVFKLTSDQFKQVEFLDEEGEEVDAEQVHQITTATGMQAFEVSEFDVERMQATVTWWAGLRPREIRSKRKSLEYVRNVYADKADKYDTVRDNLDLIVRDAVDTELSRRLAVEEDALNLDESSIQSSVQDAMESVNVSKVSESDSDSSVEKDVQEDLEIEVED
jgi:hypothetical protein